jgi:hypothetical protein
MFKVIIAGSRHFRDYERLKTVCDQWLQPYTGIEIVSGGAKGADALGTRYATEKGYPCKLFPPDWEKSPRTAGHIRNAEMATYADALMAFWDGKSKGTASMVSIARSKGLKVFIAPIPPAASKTDRGTGDNTPTLF